MPYTVTIDFGSASGVLSGYLSTNERATSGWSSGTPFAYGNTVYGFVILDAGYIPTSSDWVYISGSVGREGATYRIGSLTVSTSGNSFTVSASDTEATTIPYITSATATIRRLPSRILVSFDLYGG